LDGSSGMVKYRAEREAAMAIIANGIGNSNSEGHKREKRKAREGIGKRIAKEIMVAQRLLHAYKAQQE